MALRDLALWVVEQAPFHQQLGQIAARSVLQQFQSIHPSLTLDATPVDWSRLLLAASLLAESRIGRCQDAALRIAQSSLYLSDELLRKDVAAAILDKLANRVAIRLAERRYGLRPDVQKRLPIPLRLDWTRHSVTYSVQTQSSEVFLNRFQRSFWDAIDSYRWVSASAPTAAGKSFVLIAWLGGFLQENPKALVVYLVPTRALIHELETKMRAYFSVPGRGNVNVTSVPSADSFDSSAANIAIFTQERLQILLANEPDASIDVVIADEAHKVGDGQRGVLLQQVIEHVATHNPTSRFIFSSPLTTNPEILLEDGPTSSAPLLSQDVTVNQNLIWVDQYPRRPDLWIANLLHAERTIELGQFRLVSTPSPSSKRLPFVAFALGGNDGGNIVYENGAAAAEKTAGHLSRLVSTPSDAHHADLMTLSDLVRRTIHKRYALANALENGIAFHYGNMPLLIKAEVERLFSAGAIRYLVCTSTLVEGVNMACKNIFLRGPKKGVGKRMSADDFWNLAGRAGRWGAEFQGNVVCVDASSENVWGAGGAPKSRAAYPIRRTSDQVIKSPSALRDFLLAGTPRDTAAKRPDLEYMASYLLSQHFRLAGRLSEAPWAKRFDPRIVEQIGEAVAAVADTVGVPEAVIHRNPGISPVALTALLQYFREREGAIEELLPVSPASSDAFPSYTKIFFRIQKTLGGKLAPSAKRCKMLAMLVVQWMSGYPLARLVDNRLSFYDISDPRKVAACIRSVLEDVEQLARFEAPRALGAYRDVLIVHLKEMERTDLITDIPDVSVLLEFGVSQRTQISFMSLGLSRTAAIDLSELIVDANLSKAAALEWLHSKGWEQADLSPIVSREIAGIIAHLQGHRGPSNEGVTG